MRVHIIVFMAARTGPLLKAERIARGTPQGELARRLGLTQGRVSHLENEAHVTGQMAGRYMAALEAPDEAKSDRDEALANLAGAVADLAEAVAFGEAES
jgi:transcriptional regulator with XRE-family HTH domain